MAFTLLTASVILTIHQLSEAKHYRQQFELLHKLGMDMYDMKNVLFKQLAIYYAMSAVPALSKSVQGIF